MTMVDFNVAEMKRNIRSSYYFWPLIDI